MRATCVASSRAWGASRVSRHERSSDLFREDPRTHQPRRVVPAVLVLDERKVQQRLLRRRAAAGRAHPESGTRAPRARGKKVSGRRHALALTGGDKRPDEFAGGVVVLLQPRAGKAA